MGLLNHDSLIPTSLTNEERQQTRDKEEDTVHNAERETRLQHRTGLVGIDVEALDACSHGAEINGVRRARGDLGAVGVRDEAQFVDARDKGTNEADVDEGHEEGVGFGAVVGEERADGPGGTEHRGYEED